MIERGEPLYDWITFYFIGLIIFMIIMHIYYLKKAQKNTD